MGAVCRLQELPVTLGALPDLKALYVGHNQLVQLPGSISRLQQLQTLHSGEQQAHPMVPELGVHVL